MIEIFVNSQIMRLLILAILFIAVFSLVIILSNTVRSKSRISRHVARLRSADASAGQSPLLKVVDEDLWAKIAANIEKSGLSLSDSNSQKLEKNLKMAGYRSKHSVKIFTLTRICLVFLLPASYLFLAYISGSQSNTIQLYIISILFATVGLFLPNVFIRAKGDRRRAEIVNGFPDALDLLLVCVEAGLGLEAALDRVGREVARSHPLVASLLIETTLMMRAGASREMALRQLADGSGVDEIRSFSTLLIQSDRLGTSIASTLRVYAAEMREARRMRAEEKAHRIPVLISIPLVACMLPTMIGVLILPAAILFIRQVSPSMTGGG